MVNAIPFLWLKGGTHPLAAGPVNPGLLSRTGRSDRHRRWVPQKPGTRPTDRFAGQPDTASADSEVRPGPRAPDLTPPPDHRRGSHARSTIHTLPADSARLPDMTGYGGTGRRSFSMCLVEWHVTCRPTIWDAALESVGLARPWLRPLGPRRIRLTAPHFVNVPVTDHATSPPPPAGDN